MTDNIKAGAEIHAGDGGYSIGTQEKYAEFVKARNREPDRIMELVRESHLDVYALGKDHEKWEATVKKFAELIVRECVMCMYRRGVEGFGMLEERMLEEHFGVKE
jgi:hypothetical protein